MGKIIDLHVSLPKEEQIDTLNQNEVIEETSSKNLGHLLTEFETAANEVLGLLQQQAHIINLLGDK
jgi:hypothetical protein